MNVQKTRQLFDMNRPYRRKCAFGGWCRCYHLGSSSLSRRCICIFWCRWRWSCFSRRPRCSLRWARRFLRWFPDSQSNLKVDAQKLSFRLSAFPPFDKVLFVEAFHWAGCSIVFRIRALFETYHPVIRRRIREPAPMNDREPARKRK